MAIIPRSQSFWKHQAILLLLPVQANRPGHAQSNPLSSLPEWIGAFLVLDLFVRCICSVWLALSHVPPRKGAGMLTRACQRLRCYLSTYKICMRSVTQAINPCTARGDAFVGSSETLQVPAAKIK